jgi:acyl carrier protein
VQRFLRRLRGERDLIELPTLTYLTSGKIDREALPHPEPRHTQLARDVDEPQTTTEKTLAGIWSEVLGANPIGRQDDFFALGGHSLSAARVILDARKTFQLDISVVDVFRYPTLAGMAGLIDSTKQFGARQRRS